MGFKRPIITITVFNNDGSIFQHTVSPMRRENQHCDRPAQGSRKRRRLKQRLRQSGKSS